MEFAFIKKKKAWENKEKDIPKVIKDSNGQLLGY